MSPGQQELIYIYILQNIVFPQPQTILRTSFVYLFSVVMISSIASSMPIQILPPVPAPNILITKLITFVVTNVCASDIPSESYMHKNKNLPHSPKTHG